MRRIISYLVFLFWVFNIGVAFAAVELNLEPESSFEPEAQDMALSNLPHPIQLREVLLQENLSLPSRILLIGQYFNARYPDDAIDTDFSPDVAILFPELNGQDLYDRTTFIRRATKIYRFVQSYIAKFKEKILAPEPPPLHIEEKDIAEEDFSYVDAGEGKFAIRNDFRKVLTYGQNPRDMRAIEAFEQRKLDAQKKKTNFEKFKSMVAKLEFSKIPFYGISEPNPFTGNAGIGEWVEKDGIRLRLISELAEIGDEKEFLVAIHFDVPTYRFILAQGNQKPQVEFEKNDAIQSAEVFYPRQISVVDDVIVGAYADNFAMPIRLKINPLSKDLELAAHVKLLSCDFNLRCQELEFSPSLEIEHAESAVYSSMQNFIKQALYNVPQEQNKYLQLDSFGAEMSADQQKVERILLTFDYDSSGHNLTLFLEDDDQTRFALPDVTFMNQKIYVSVVPLNHQESLIGKNLTVTAFLNAYTQLRRTIELKSLIPAENIFQNATSGRFMDAFYCGLLFYFSLIGLVLWALSFRIKDKKAYFRFAALGVFVAVNLFGGALYLLSSHTALYWGAQYQAAPYLIFALLGASFFRLLLRQTRVFLPKQTKAVGFLTALLLICLAPVSCTPLLAQSVGATLNGHFMAYFLTANGFALGVVLPFILLQKEIPSPKIKEIIRLLALSLLYFLSAFILLLVLMQFSVLKTLFLVLLSVCGGLILRYAFSFFNALMQTRAKTADKEKMFFIFSGVFAFCLLFIMAFGFMIKLDKTPSKSSVPQEDILKEIRSGQTVLIAYDADWCLACRYNHLTVLTPQHLQDWEKIYHLSYHEVDATNPSAEMLAYFQKFRHVDAPLYVLYNYNINEGLLLPDILSASGLEQTLDRLKL